MLVENVLKQVYIVFMSEKNASNEMKAELKDKFGENIFNKAMEIHNRSEDEKIYREQAVCVPVKEFIEDGKTVQKVLLVKSQKAIGAGRESRAWSLAQGGADSAEETTEDVAIREFGEEVFLSEELQKEDFVTVGETYKQDFGLDRICKELDREDPREFNGKRYRHVAFKTSGEITGFDPEEINDARWMTVDDAEQTLEGGGNPAKFDQQMDAIRQAVQAVG